MISPQGRPGGSSGAGVSVGSTWSDAPCPVLVVDRDGGIVEVNDAARALLPRAADAGRLPEGLPDWLADAHRRMAGGRDAAHADPLSGAIGDRLFDAHPTPSSDGDVVWWLIDDTDRRLAEETLRSEQERAAILSEVSSTLLSSLSLSHCMESTARLAAHHLADAAVLIAPAQGLSHPVTSALADGPVTLTTRAVDPATVPGLAEALQGFPPVPTRWIDPGAVPSWAIPEGFKGPVGSVIVTPLPGHGIPDGALILLRSDAGPAFTESEDGFARLLAARAGAALSAARLYDDQARITAVLMRELLPPALGGVHGVEYAGRYRPFQDSERIGGDFYDVHPGADPSQESLVVLGDVAGKGLDAAVLTGRIRNTLHALLPLAHDHAYVLNLLNAALLRSPEARFATLVLASARRRGNRVRLRLTSAGHPPPLVLRADGRVEETRTRGDLVGVMPTVSVRTEETVLAPGETCLLYTDGITEARGGPLGGELYGLERLERDLAGCAGMPAEAVVERVHMLAAQWLGQGRHDDMAVVAISAPRTGPLAVISGYADPHNARKRQGRNS
ncbi:PP2C family protein-serine/threonine phosphatase [Streptomyces poonensis]|uniref:PPM-type phosphatase domain-containing protein n=1 Tax=Streptomyces poonensis TaxID=68255 RepID=A0A918UFC4_9ACTN|nr:PP2C family protein-serine/threonine phosphatase [Streptomyces poonensis]GGY99591.1 hypothetical protein GCM10010365_17870 [Streptomyces poonensis]GLJ93931.1 hypothetical protein GCM10017589_65510 [Streptomyces poonensis]